MINFKKIATVLGSALMIGSTVGMAAAASYPTPFVQSGAANVAIVIGSSAALSDAVAATNINSQLASKLAAQTATGGSTGATASGGDNQNLATTSQRLYWNSTLDSARTTLTSSEMKTLLKDGSVMDDTGTSYSYTQSVVVGNTSVEYSTASGNILDPTLILNVGYASTKPVYTYKLTFNKPINVTSSNVQGNEIEIFGKKFTIGANSDTTTGATPILYLYGSGQSVTLNEGEEAPITINGVDHKIKLVGVDVNSKASVTVDGGTIREIAEGSSSKSGGLEIYVKTSFYSAKESSTNYATLNVGGESLKLQTGQTVYKGSDEIAIQNTKVTLTNSTTALSGIQIAVAMQDTTKAFIKAGDSFTDPVFGGLKIQFAGVTPTLEDTTRDKVVFDTDNSRNAKVTFTSALDTTERQFNILHDQDTSESTINPTLSTSGNRTIHVIENDTIKINEFVVINSGDKGRIIQITGIPNGALQASSTIQAVDALTGENVFSSSGGLTVGTTGKQQANINGQPYFFTVDTNTAGAEFVTINWGTGASYGVTGGEAGGTGATTILPRIQLKGGEWLTILAPIALANGTKYSLPGEQTLSTYEAGHLFGSVYGTAPATQFKALGLGDANRTGWIIGNANWTVEGTDATPTDGNTTGLLMGLDTNNDATIDCNFNATQGGGIMVQEAKKTTEASNAADGDIICVAADASGSTTPVEISVGTPKVSHSWSSLQTWSSDSYQQSGVTRYGTYVKYSSLENDKVEIYYPIEQMFADVLFTAEAATVNAGSSGSGTVSELGTAVYYDNQAASYAGKNLIVVGGSCINSVAASLLGGNLCGADFTAKTGVSDGGYLIQTFDYSGKIAMLVAGYNAADTTKAVTDLTNNADKFDTTVGKKYTGTLTTVATSVTASTNSTA